MQVPLERKIAGEETHVDFGLSPSLMEFTLLLKMGK